MVVLPSEVAAAVDGFDLTPTLPARMVFVMRLSPYLIVMLGLLPQGESSWSADDSVNEKRRFLAAGMRSEREKLRSGQVEMRGEHSHLTREFPNFRVPVRFRYDFDHSSRKYRHETRDYIPYDMNARDASHLDDEKTNPDLPHGVTEKGIQWFSREIGGTTIHTPQYSLFKMCRARHVDRMPPGTQGIIRIREMDVRVFGITDWLMFSQRTPYDALIDAIETTYSGASVVGEENGISHLSFKTGGEILLEIWVDERRGMTPIRLVRTELFQGNRESSRSDVSWEPIGGTWVPKTFAIQSNYKSGSMDGLALTLDWKSVNEPLDHKIFTAAGIADEDGNIQSVADTTLGKTIIEQINPLLIATPKPVQPKPPSRLGWIVLGHLIAGGGVSWWYYRRRSRRQSAGST